MSNSNQAIHMTRIIVMSSSNHANHVTDVLILISNYELFLYK